MAPELGPTDAPETAVDVSDPRLPQDSPASAATAPEDTPEPSVAEVAAAVRQLASPSERYHLRAEQREAVIDHQRDEVDRLRRGERRGLLRPLLAETCRLRNDLLRQAGELPADFDAERAAAAAVVCRIRRDHAGETAASRCPRVGDLRPAHAPTGRRPAARGPGPGRADRQHHRDGYLDVDSSSPLAPAEVVVFGTRRLRDIRRPHRQRSES